MITRIFTPPHFDNEEDNFRAKFINGFAWIVIGILGIALLTGGLNFLTNSTDPVLMTLILVQALSLYLLRKGKIQASGWILVILSWLGLTFQAYSADGVKDVVVVGYIAVALLTSIVVNWLTGFLIIVASIGAIWSFAFLEINQIITPRFQDPINYGRDLTFVFLAITAMIYFSTTSLRDAIRRANQSEESLRTSNKELQELNQNLEDRVSSRTAELELANQRNQKRARQFEAIARVARAAASIQDEATLLNRLAQVISEQFGFYHTGIFLIDEERENAVLRAANSEGGRRMLERGHKLKIGQIGIVGYVTAAGNPRIALDVGTDAVFFNNPDLPDTRSELALPLRVGDEVIGALDVQSTESNAFQKEDAEVLTTLADQIAIAIQNARSFETTQQLLEETQKISGSFMKDAWRALREEQQQVGYLVSKEEVKPLQKPVVSTQIRKAMEEKVTVTENGKAATLAVPIRLRNEVIGVMDIRVPEEHDWDPDEVDIVEAVADRLSLAVESSLLLRTTQRRAEIERLTTDITGKISSTTQFDSILRTAAEELSRALGGSEVLVQIQPISSSNSSGNS